MHLFNREEIKLATGPALQKIRKAHKVAKAIPPIGDSLGANTAPTSEKALITG